MKKLIFKYLFDNYYWYENQLWSNPEQRATVRSISDDLQVVFGLTEKQTKWYIKSWCKRNPRFNFNKAWAAKLSFRFETVEVRSGTRTLRASWTPEMTFEERYHNIDAEAELITILEQELARAMIEDLKNVYLREETNS